MTRHLSELRQGVAEAIRSSVGARSMFAVAWLTHLGADSPPRTLRGAQTTRGTRTASS
jgi:hypothetical protein